MSYEAPLKVLSGTALTDEQKKDLLNRLARVEGQVRGVRKLLAKAVVPDDCDGVAQQMAAARKALDRAFVNLLTSAMVSHTSGSTSLEDAAERAKHLSEMLNKFA
ncbi:MAG: metal-sensing transcriptional repressor [Oxalobacteraceae bacterium]